jgi:hypothetical protein
MVTRGAAGAACKPAQVVKTRIAKTNAERTILTKFSFIPEANV